MRSPSHRRVLSAVPLFAEASPAQLDRIASLTTSVEVPSGRALTTEGSIGREFFVVEDGEASVTIGDEEVAVLGPGSFFGEIALLRHERRNATVTALSPMTVLVLSPSEFHQVVQMSPAIAARVHNVAEARLEEDAGRQAAA